jgi:hypothetical protein
VQNWLPSGWVEHVHEGAAIAVELTNIGDAAAQTNNTQASKRVYRFIKASKNSLRMIGKIASREVTGKN